MRTDGEGCKGLRDGVGGDGTGRQDSRWSFCPSAAEVIRLNGWMDGSMIGSKVMFWFKSVVLSQVTNQ